ncbi:hypothetical protein K435DRAFT_604174, partial [Dendrothele bispora CBS 962.96]
LLCVAVSAEVERGFSRGGLMVTKRRYRLSDDSIKASTLLLFWGKVPGLLPEVLIARVL